jgi:hypothetical protein
MSKPITVILQGQEILASFTDYDSAVREFKTLTTDKGELSLHILNRPDRKKGRPLVVANVQPAPRPATKRNKESLL